jgi:molecular chaperone GrpE
MDNDKDIQLEQGEVSLGGGVDIVTQSGDIDDVEFETYNDDVLGSETLTPQDQIKRLRERLKEAVKEKREYLDGWQRTKADFANYKKREDEQKTEFMKFAREGIIGDIIPVLESFQMAFSNKDAWQKVDPSWRTGVEYIHTQLVQTLANHGLTPIDPRGALFDPKVHTAVASVPTEDAALDHHIAEVVSLGYQLSGKVIRSPRVKVYAVSSGV